MSKNIIRRICKILVFVMLLTLFSTISGDLVVNAGTVSSQTTPKLLIKKKLDTSDSDEVSAQSIIIKIKYRIRYRSTKPEKDKPSLSNKKIKTTQGEIVYIKLYNANAKEVKWYSKNKKRATVKRDGKWCGIKAKKTGKVTIIAKYKGKKYKCKVIIKKKKKRAFNCWPHKNGETLKFKSDGYYYNKEIKKWFMSRQFDYEESFMDDLETFFEPTVYPETLTYEIGNTDVMRCKWGKYEGGLGWKLKFYPQGEGTTYLKITNSYNSQSMYFPIVVKDDYVPPSKRFLSLEQSEYTVNDFNDLVVVRIRCSKDAKTLAYEDVSGYLGDSTYCVIEKIEKETKNSFLCYIRTRQNGTSKLIFHNSDDWAVVTEPVIIRAKVPNKVIHPETDQAELLIGETTEVKIQTDIGAPVVVETDNNNISVTKNAWEEDKKTFTLSITGVTEGDSVITIRNWYDGGTICKINVKVRYIETTGIAITNKREYFSCFIIGGKSTTNQYILKANVYPTNATNQKITWETSDPKIAKVDVRGILRALNSGTVTIKATTYNGISDEFVMNVSVKSFD